MKISVLVVTGAKKNLVKVEPSGLKVYLTAPPIDGRANEALVALLAEHFEVRKSRIEITKGLKSRNKVIKINA